MKNNLLQNPKIQEIYKSVLTEEYNSEKYKQKRFELISHSEGFKRRTYYDIFNHKTIGYGFNLDQIGAKKIWQQALGCEKKFNSAINGNLELEKGNAKKLMNYILDKNQKYIQKDYDGCFNSLSSDIKISIESSYYNCPKIVNKGTNFHINITKYISTNNIFYLIKSYYELNFKSNPTNSLGIKNRRINDTPTRIIALLNSNYS